MRSYRGGAQEAQPHIICPIRFVQDRRIFLDAVTLFEPQDNTRIIVVPELGLPIGRIDYILVQYDLTSQRVHDFLVLEVMACSTTSTGDVLRSFHNILQERPTEQRLKYGINYRQVLSRMMVQVLAKAYACERWRVPMIWAVQDVLFNYMQATTKVQLELLQPTDLRSQIVVSPILFFVYGMDMDTNGQRFKLHLRSIHGGAKESFARILEPQGVPEGARVIELIQHKIQTGAAVFTLDMPLSDTLARVARDQVTETTSLDE